MHNNTQHNDARKGVFFCWLLHFLTCVFIWHNVQNSLSVFMLFTAYLNCYAERSYADQGWVRSLNRDRKLIRYDKIQLEISVSPIWCENDNYQKHIKFWYQDYKIFCFLNVNDPQSDKSRIMTIYNFTKNIDLTLICTHTFHNLHDVISNLYHFDYKNISFILYIQK